MNKKKYLLVTAGNAAIGASIGGFTKGSKGALIGAAIGAALAIVSLEIERAEMERLDK